MKLYDSTKGKKTTGAMVAYILLRVVNEIWPGALTPDQFVLCMDIVTVAGAIGIGDKLLTYLKNKKNGQKRIIQ
jgi:hypothetical protein